MERRDTVDLLQAIVREWARRKPETPCPGPEEVEHYARAAMAVEASAMPEVGEHLLECGACMKRYAWAMAWHGVEERLQALAAGWDDVEGLMALIADASRPFEVRVMACERLQAIGGRELIPRLQEMREREADPDVWEALGATIEALERVSVPEVVATWLKGLRGVIGSLWVPLPPVPAALAAAGPEGERVWAEAQAGPLRVRVTVGPDEAVWVRVETEDEALEGKGVRVRLGEEEVEMRIRRRPGGLYDEGLVGRVAHLRLGAEPFLAVAVVEEASEDGR